MPSILLLLFAALWLAWTVLAGRVDRPRHSAQVSTCESTDTSRFATVMFEPDSTALNSAQMPALKFLAGDINSRLRTGSATLELRAYGGSVGEVSARAFDISRKRGLALRNTLMSDGVSGDRIALRPMSGAIRCASPDRVDLLLRKN
ncbi:MAG TPA: OmpA family protein [Rhizomicrobium sp.]|nr:OmpA family protein [Rhizomicrobium sp.]